MNAFRKRKANMNINPMTDIPKIHIIMAEPNVNMNVFASDML